ncbi:hypothetical protein BX600DRAFT_433742 [Xylariales sp. PMI_506]|nr:hypothetical protein BX600DRAFT_433742 [Xylariales sp. PMI_506]
MSSSSRKGRKISRKACDLCRDRKVQCTFSPDSPETCQNRIQDAQRRALLTLDSPAEVENPAYSASASARLGSLPIGELTVDHLIPRPTFRAIINEFLERVYPLLPLVHVPEFTARFESGDYDRDSSFFRLCIAVCAATMASIPRQIETYGCNTYQHAGELVQRAVHIVLLSRLSANPFWQNQPCVNEIVVSVLLSYAAHYAAWPNVGWAYASEATHAFRGMKLYTRDAYSILDSIDAELCKRTFWLLYFGQVHDRLIHSTAHTSLCYDPLATDWDFLFPLELDDDQLRRDLSAFNMSATPPRDSRRPVISGYIALIKIFQCVADVLCRDFPGQPILQAMPSGSFGRRWLPQGGYSKKYPRSRRAALFDVVETLRAALRDLPDELKFSSHLASSDPAYRPDGTEREPISQQFATMQVNIYVTSLHLQCVLLDMCVEAPAEPSGSACSPSAGSSSSPAAFTLDSGVEVTADEEIWRLRESLAGQLLEFLTSSNLWTLESNGRSMIVKIREIAASLLIPYEMRNSMTAVQERCQQYITEFVDILARMDYESRLKQQAQGATGSQSVEIPS